MRNPPKPGARPEHESSDFADFAQLRNPGNPHGAGDFADFAPGASETEAHTPKVGRLQPRFGNDNTDSVKRDLMQATLLTLQWRASRRPGVFADDTRETRRLAIGVHDPVLEAIETEPNMQDAGAMLRAMGICTEGGPYVTGAMKGRDWLNLDGRTASPIAPIKKTPCFDR